MANYINQWHCPLLQAPCPSDADIKELVTNREILNTDQKRYLGPIPCNLFTVCDDSDALIAVKWLKEKVTSSKGKDFTVVVFGGVVVLMYFLARHLHFLHIIIA